jgi:FtsH-binding integral membrane protein
MIDNPAWGMMCVTLMFVIPTWFFFHFAPRHSYHTFAEGILIQIYMATIVLIATFISYLTEPYVLVLFIVYYYFTYRQLFGYRFWGTLWRLLLIMVVAFWGVVLSMSIVINIGSSTFNVTGIFRELAIIVVLLSAGYLICRRTAKNRYAIDDK